MVHTFQALGVNVAVDVNSGAVHVLDELTYHLLEQVKPPIAEHCPEEVCQTLSRYAPRRAGGGVAGTAQPDCGGAALRGGRLHRPGEGGLHAAAGTGEGAVPPRLPRLQSPVQILLCLYRRLRHRPSPDHGRRDRQAGHRLCHRQIRPSPEHRSGLLRRRTADGHGYGEADGGICPLHRGSTRKVFPLYHYHQRRTA